VILGESLEQVINYRDLLKIPFPILADPEREVYHRFEMTKNFIGLQRTASIVIDENGIIRYLKRVYNPMTWLQESQKIVQVVQNWPTKK
jgi:alkyl hydroperoxide reductase subunit AhpC